MALCSRSPPGYERAFWGYAASEHYTHSRSDAVCVDYAAVPMPVVSTKGDDNGMLFYPFESESSSAPGYIDQWEITCALCRGSLGGVAL